MTMDNYMALADFQTLWSEKIKPKIPEIASTPEAVCSTAPATAAKVTDTTPPSFSLVSGAKIIVKFTYAITVANATLKVGDTDAKPIFYHDVALGANLVKAGTSLLLSYDGTNFNIVGDINTAILSEDKEEVIAAAINDLNNNKQSNSRVRKTDFSMGDLQAAVEAQSLEMFGLKVGDSTTINGHKYVIAGLNAFKSTTFSKAVTLLKHVALIVIPGTTQAWNVSGNTYTGANSYKSDSNVAGYLNSDLHYYLVNTVLPLVRTDLGGENLIYNSKLISNAVNQSGVNKLGETTGCSSGYEWVDQEYISALTEAQVYGSTIWSSSGYDSGEAYRQLDVFKNFGFTEIFGSNDIWLRDIVSATKAAYLDNQGSANNDTASVTKNIAALVLFH